MDDKSEKRTRKRERKGLRETRLYAMFRAIFPAFTAAVIVLSIFGPEMLSRYQDRNILNKIHVQEMDENEGGYRYALSSAARIHIFSEALSTQNQQGEKTYAFVVNHREAEEKEISQQQVYEVCNRELAQLREQGILPENVKNVDSEMYDAVLYSAIDVLEPRNNVAVWRISLSDLHRNSDKNNRIIEVYLDGENGKIYEFFARTDYDWPNINTQTMIAAWAEYMELPGDITPETSNPLMVTTPNVRCFAISTGEEKTTAAIGFYEGINELFLRVSR